MYLSCSFFSILLFESLFNVSKATGLYGIVTKKVEPFPLSDFKVILPPSNSAFSLAIDKPNPNPPTFLDNSSEITHFLENG